MHFELNDTETSERNKTTGIIILAKLFRVSTYLALKLIQANRTEGTRGAKTEKNH